MLQRPESNGSGNTFLLGDAGRLQSLGLVLSDTIELVGVCVFLFFLVLVL